ncbi:MAG: UPF0149 family protein [Panacagrimonas sp.]
MPMSTRIDLAELTAVLHPLGCDEPPSGYHGTVCGALCVESPEHLDPVSLLIGADEPDERARGFLVNLRDQCNVALLSARMDFWPLLPPVELPLSLRVEALVAWCGGFLYGLWSRRRIDMHALSEEGRRIVQDFTGFTETGIAAMDETSYAECVGYIRAGAQLLFLELRQRPSSTADADAHALH